MKRMIERFKIAKKNVQAFAIEDTFNKNNLLEGYISASHGKSYGSMLITAINNEPTEQWIFSTPKLNYPFDRNGNYHFPKAQEIRIYDKLDGTNILAYSYEHKGKRFLTYKLRRSPIVRNSEKFGPFKDMLLEMLDKEVGLNTPYKKLIEPYVLRKGVNLSFELWGARNTHLMLYTTPLEMSLLFKINQLNGDVIPINKDDPFPMPESLVISDKANYVQFYKWMQEEDDKKIEKTEMGMKGSEGKVWYMKLETGNWCMFKCKPHQVEDIHWAEGLGKNIIRATALNVLENYAEITFEGVKELLLETFVKKDIDEKRDFIEEIIKEINETFEFEAKVLEEYQRIGISIWQDKANVMRAISPKFPKNKMKYVYWVIANKGEKLVSKI